LTLEQPQVGQLLPFNGLDEETLLTYAATAEYRQPHPIARAILAAAEERGLHLPPIDEATYQVGYGIKVYVAGKLIRVGSARFLSQEGITLPNEIKEMQAEAAAQGYSLVYVAVDEQFGGAIHRTCSRHPSTAIIRHLRQRNMDLYIISGDHEQPAAGSCRSKHQPRRCRRT
jgi:Cu2+-exporting ATPase